MGSELKHDQKYAQRLEKMIVMLTCSERESTSLDQLQQYVFHTVILQTGSASSLNHSGNTGLQTRQAEHRVQKDQKSYLFQSMTERKNSTRISGELSGLHCKKVSLVTIVGEAKIRRQKRLHRICLNNHLDLTKKHTMMPMQGRIEVDEKSECWEKKVESGRLCTYYIYEIYNTVN